MHTSFSAAKIGGVIIVRRLFIHAEKLPGEVRVVGVRVRVVLAGEVRVVGVRVREVRVGGVRVCYLRKC